MTYKLTEDTWGRCAAILRARFGNALPMKTKLDIDVWYELLAEDGYTDEQVYAAVKHLAKSQKSSFVGISDITDIINAASANSWADAWEEVIERQHEFYSPIWGRKPPQWSSPTIEQVVKQMGGISAIVKIDLKDIHIHRAQFRDMFNAIETKKKITDNPALAAGNSIVQIGGR